MANVKNKALAACMLGQTTVWEPDGFPAPDRETFLAAMHGRVLHANLANCVYSEFERDPDPDFVRCKLGLKADPLPHEQVVRRRWDNVSRKGFYGG